jgi:hypothetical protein
MIEESSSADVLSLVHFVPAGNETARGQSEKPDAQDGLAAYVLGGWWERPSTPPLSLGSAARSGTGQRRGEEHVGVGREAVDIVEGIPSWSRDGASRHASNAFRDWTDEAVRHESNRNQ